MTIKHQKGNFKSIYYIRFLHFLQYYINYNMGFKMVCFAKHRNSHTCGSRSNLKDKMRRYLQVTGNSQGSPCFKWSLSSGLMDYKH